MTNFDSCTSEILKNLAAEDNSDSESDAVKEKQRKTKLNRRPRHVKITVIKQQLEFHYLRTRKHVPRVEVWENEKC